MVLDFGEVLIYIACYFGLFTAFYFLIILFENRHDLKDTPNKNFSYVTVVVPAYNEEKTLAKTLDSLLSLDYPSNKLEILVVDDGSKDNTLKIAKAYAKAHPQVTALHQKNSGKGRALNNAIKQAKGDFVGALDADSFVDPNALQCIMSRFGDSKTMAVTPSMKVYQAKGFLPIIQEVEYIIGVFLRKVFAFAGSIHVTPGPFSIFRKSFFEKYGGYDEHNLTEDIEIALRIQSNGFHIENALGAHVYTVCPKTFKALLNQRLRWYYGFFQNVQDYKKLFGVRTGNLGIIMLPAALISIVISILLLFDTLWNVVTSSFNHIESIYYLGWTYFATMSFSFDSFQMFNEITFLAAFTLIISIVMIYVANKLSGGTKGIAIKYLIFSLFYWFFYSMWWLTAALYRFTGKKVGWGGRQL